MFENSKYHRALNNPNKTMILTLLMFVLSTFNADDTLVDEEHLKRYPFCGRMNFRNNIDCDQRYPFSSCNAKGRVVNSKDAIESYRWVVRITRKARKTRQRWQTSRCSGSIITER